MKRLEVGKLEPEAWLSLVAILVSLVSFSLSFFQTSISSKTQVRPIVVIVYDGAIGWIARNVGSGPALNIVVAQRASEGGWKKPVRIPPLATSTDFHLRWLGHTNTEAIGVAYEDLQGRTYTSVCRNDLSSVRDGYHLTQWEEREIGRHWWVDPTRATRRGELR